MNDRELLELAAKAAGVSLYYMPLGGAQFESDRGVFSTNLHRFWTPLTEDGDALRLAVKLEIDIRFLRKHVDAIADKRILHGEPKGFQNLSLFSEWSKDRDCATRRAIVRAAAEIGKAMT